MGWYSNIILLDMKINVILDSLKYVLLVVNCYWIVYVGVEYVVLLV